MVESLKRYGRWPRHGEKIPYQTVGNIGGKRQTVERFEFMDIPQDLAGISVLDIGCSVGMVCNECVQRGATATGFDKNSKMLKVVKKLVPLGNFYTADIDRYPNGFGFLEAYDVVFCMSVIKHVKEDKLAQLLGDVSWKTCYFEGHYKTFSQERDMDRFCEKYGFGVVKRLGHVKDQKPRRVWQLEK